ncbi:MAG TPA: AAA family ATPase [Buchnera sp. (in: enterobacteria)]|nr:AAA family ATPase [Buchnera sp. (in: enterobacteria)]
MKRTIMLIPINDHVGLTSIIISLITVIKEKNLKICFFKPLITCFNNSVTSDYTTDLIRQNLLVDCIDPIILNDKNSFFNDSYISSLIDNIVEQYYLYIDKYDIIIVSGLKSTEIGALSTMLNCKIH